MPHTWHLGNDIVDLVDPRHTGKTEDTRFLLRVFSETEQEEIQAAPDPDQALWLRWAGKEAAFKSVSKFLGKPPVFMHPLFRVSLFDSAVRKAGPGRNPDSSMIPLGEVHYEEMILPLRGILAPSHVHVVTWIPGSRTEAPDFRWGSAEFDQPLPDWKAVLGPRLSTTEWDCISHQASAMVRLEARSAIASAWDLDEHALEVGCGAGQPGRRIPKVLLGGKELPVDLTLSHHGRLLAWAFLPNPVER